VALQHRNESGRFRAMKANKTEVRLATTKGQIARCFPVMAELRPHLIEDEFVERIRRQRKQSGYEMAFLDDAGAVRAVAGFRVTECLWSGKYFYVDDLVTAAGARNRGWGQRMMDWLLKRAREEGCKEFQLDSGVQRFEAHGFYLKNRLHIVAYHFRRTLS
jgi:GNAT superfamily N-acetyltransferase